MQTHTSYTTSKKLKAFLGESAPKPIRKEWHYGFGSNYEGFITEPKKYEDCFLAPAYQLHDILSRPFCEAFLNAMEEKKHWCPVDGNDELSHELAYKYFFGGLPAVEAALCKMMEDK